MLAGRVGGILEAQRRVDAALANRCDEVGRAALDHAQLEVGRRCPQANDRGGDEAGQNARERPQPELGTRARCRVR
jgi:hypothetical protein